MKGGEKMKRRIAEESVKRDLEELWKYIDLALIIMLFIFAVLMEVVKAFFRKCSSSIKSMGETIIN